APQGVQRREGLFGLLARFVVASLRGERADERRHGLQPAQRGRGAERQCALRLDLCLDRLAQSQKRLRKQKVRPAAIPVQNPIGGQDYVRKLRDLLVPRTVRGG